MQSTDAIRYYVKGAFQGVKETPEVLEQQEEVIANLSAKVDDLVSEGKSEAEALGIALASVGDLGGLAAQFESAGPKPVLTAVVYGGRLDFHVVVVTVAVGVVLMMLSVALGAIAGGIYPESGLPLVLTLAAAVWWIATAWKTFRQAPEKTESRELAYKPRIRHALMVWAGVCGAALLLELVTGGFWPWPIWVAATGWLSHVWAERALIAHGMFVVPEETASAASSPERREAIGDKVLA